MNIDKHRETLEKLLMTINQLGSEVSTSCSDPETREVLTRSLTIQAYMLTNDLKECSQNARLEFELNPREYLELRQIYQTYIGIAPGLDSRFDITYLSRIPLMVLIGCLPSIRRGDFLVEKGNFTSVVVSSTKIIVPVTLPSSKEVFVSDIRCWHSGDCVNIAAPYAPLKYRQVDQGPYEQMGFLDNIVTDQPLPLFFSNERVPRYTDPKKRYYDKMSTKPDVLKKFKVVDLSRGFSMAL